MRLTIILILISIKLSAVNIENKYVSVIYENNRITAVSKVEGINFIENGKLVTINYDVIRNNCDDYINAKITNSVAKVFNKKVVKVEKKRIKHKTFGKGESIQISYQSGSKDFIILFPELPFVIIKKQIHNSTADKFVLNKIVTFKANVDCGISKTKLKAFGTDGPQPLKDYGSYAYMVIVEPYSRKGVVSGWISHQKSDGIVFTNKNAEISAQADHGKLVINPNETVDLDLLAIGYFNDSRIGLEQYADVVAKIEKVKLPPIPTVYCTWYDTESGGRALNETKLKENTNNAHQLLRPYGFSVMQIDDYWQQGEPRNGPAKIFKQHKVNGPYPSGMAKTANYIKSKGFTAGIWWMPFAADRNDPFFMERPDWMAKNEDGTHFYTKWSGATLDLSYKPVRDYIGNISKMMSKDWGYKYFKMDGIHIGLGCKQTYVNKEYVVDDLGLAFFSDEGKTPIEIYRDGFKLIRKNAGDDVFFLGCCARQNMRSFGPSFGMVDAMRIGPDNHWQDLTPGPLYGGQTYFLHGRVWYNDPDPLYVRASVPLLQAQSIASWQALSGQMNTTSENYITLPEERLKILRQTMPNHGLKPRPADLFENTIPSIWLLSNNKKVKRNVVGLFNWDLENEKTISVSLEYIGLLNTEYIGFDLWEDQFIDIIKDSIKVTLKPGQCKIFALKQLTDQPTTISTSRHITQGIVDITNENWDDEKRELSGTSKVIANDPYELRIFTNLNDINWKPYQAFAFSNNNNQNVDIKIVEQTKNHLRVVINSDYTTDVNWKIQ